MWFLFLFILQNLLHICCRFPAGNIKVKPIMRLHSTAHNCHHFVSLTNENSLFSLADQWEGRGGECMPGHTLLLLLSSLPGHSLSLNTAPDANTIANPVHSEILNLKMPGQWAHNWPSDGQNMALWTDVNTGDMTHGHHLSSGLWLARSVTVLGSYWLIIQVSHLSQCQGPSLLFALWCSKAQCKQQMLWFKMLQFYFRWLGRTGTRVMANIISNSITRS